MARKGDSYAGQILSCETVLTHVVVHHYLPPVICHLLMECPHYNEDRHFIFMVHGITLEVIVTAYLMFWNSSMVGLPDLHN
jgi:hypothetical protein